MKLSCPASCDAGRSSVLDGESTGAATGVIERLDAGAGLAAEVREVQREYEHSSGPGLVLDTDDVGLGVSVEAESASDDVAGGIEGHRHPVG